MLAKLKWGFIGILFIIPTLSFAYYSNQPGLGDFAKNLFGDAMAVSQIVKTICVITGACFIIASIVQYKKYRKNPTEVRLSMPICSLLTGLVLIGLYFIPFAF